MKIGITILIIFLLLIMLVLIRALLVAKPKKNQYQKIDKNFKKETNKYSQSLSKMLQIPTISKSNNLYEYKVYEFHKFIKTNYKNILKTCEIKDFDGGLMIKWSGENHKNPIVLMSHFDVADINGNWKKNPFSGDIENGKIYGRGTVDTKGSLCAELEAVESLIKENFKTQRDIYILSSSNEEIAGNNIPCMVKYFEENKIVPIIVLDEGGAIIDSPIKSYKGEIAVVATSEKGTVQILIKAKNYKNSKKPMLRIAKFIEKANKTNFSKPKLPTELKITLNRLVPYMTFKLKLFFANFNIDSKLGTKFLCKFCPEFKSMIQTSISFKNPNDSDLKDFLTNEVGVLVNLSYSPYVNITESLDILQKLLDKYKLEAKIINSRECGKPEDFKSDGFCYLENCINKVFGNAIPVCPFILTGGTDARHFVGYAKSVIRFAPIYISNEQFSTIHNDNENINENSITNAVEFYREFIVSYDKNH